MQSKENHKQDEKINLGMRENICKWMGRAAQYPNNKQPKQKMDEDLHKHFSKEDTQIVKKHMKRHST